MKERSKELLSVPDAGFTLLETLVALTIVAVGFAWAFGALPESLGAQDRARNLEAATSLAESALARAVPGEGKMDRFVWQVEDSAIGATGGQVIRTTVRWAEGTHARSITLQTVRLGTSLQNQ